MIEKHTNEQSYKDAAELVETAAYIIGRNCGEYTKVTKTYNNGNRSVRFTTDDKTIRQLANAIGLSDANANIDEKRMVTIKDNNDSILAQIVIEENGFTVSISDNLLTYSRFTGVSL